MQKMGKHRLLLTFFIIILGIAMVGIANAATVNNAQMSVDEMNAVMEDVNNTQTDQDEAADESNNEATETDDEATNDEEEIDDEATNENDDDAVTEEDEDVDDSQDAGDSSLQMGPEMMKDAELQEKMQKVHETNNMANNMDIEDMNKVHEDMQTQMADVQQDMQDQMVQSQDDMAGQMHDSDSSGSKSSTSSKGGMHR